MTTFTSHHRAKPPLTILIFTTDSSTHVGLDRVIVRLIESGKIDIWELPQRRR